jgi:hypothetical protein
MKSYKRLIAKRSRARLLRPMRVDSLTAPLLDIIARDGAMEARSS